MRRTLLCLVTACRAPHALAEADIGLRYLQAPVPEDALAASRESPSPFPYVEGVEVRAERMQPDHQNQFSIRIRPTGLGMLRARNALLDLYGKLRAEAKDLRTIRIFEERYRNLIDYDHHTAKVKALKDYALALDAKSALLSLNPSGKAPDVAAFEKARVLKARVGHEIQALETYRQRLHQDILRAVGERDALTIDLGGLPQAAEIKAFLRQASSSEGLSLEGNSALKHLRSQVLQRSLELAYERGRRDRWLAFVGAAYKPETAEREAETSVQVGIELPLSGGRDIEIVREQWDVERKQDELRAEEAELRQELRLLLAQLQSTVALLEELSALQASSKDIRGLSQLDHIERTMSRLELEQERLDLLHEARLGLLEAGIHLFGRAFISQVLASRSTSHSSRVEEGRVAP